ncbi:Peroxisomal nicotinamide adenine dinucleotide carrier [Apostasia shenzhenica]|uniref:Peroxisomal nicotinamide adenine dinucleotide carrier n=1 Tax=Apostasia shenzhenica TaxID=1088818 RepID=A0A2I0AXW8_9ASPA|nr:Peroxisomal nicotinamide adenine dinucleotide carrier [Apostasia shenzhenica]
MSHALANGMAGAGGGIIAQILTYPLQIVNTRQQTERTAEMSIERRLPSSSATEEVADVNGKEARRVGLKPSLLGTAASQGYYYYFYQIFKNRAEAIAIALKKRGQGDGNVGVFSWLVIAALAGGTLDAIIKMTRYEGLLGFYKGMGTKMVQSVFAAAVLFVVKEELVKAYLISHVKTSKILIKPGK